MRMVVIHDGWSATLARAAGADLLLVAAVPPPDAHPAAPDEVALRTGAVRRAVGDTPVWAEVPPTLVAAGRPLLLPWVERLLSVGAAGFVFPPHQAGLELMFYTAEAKVPTAALIAVGPEPTAEQLVAAEDAQAAGAHLLLLDEAPYEVRRHLEHHLSIPVLARPGHGAHRLIRFQDALLEPPPAEAETLAAALTLVLRVLLDAQRAEPVLGPDAARRLGLDA